MTYDLQPKISVKSNENAYLGYEEIGALIKQEVKKGTANFTVVIECYPGVKSEEIKINLQRFLQASMFICADDLAIEEEEMNNILNPYLTDDRVFGRMTHFQLKEFFNLEKVKAAQESIVNQTGVKVIYGTGASLVTHGDMLIYADLSRWEIQKRFKHEKMNNWNVTNQSNDMLKKFKRGYFFEWRMADKLKHHLTSHFDFYLDTHATNQPKMIHGPDYRTALSQLPYRPFRLVPYFDESVWGGTWMQEHLGANTEARNLGWAFDGVPEENSLLLSFNETCIEVPAINLVHEHPIELLGSRIYRRFGAEFPIRFDYLDTMGGGNLSLQVHPTTEYIKNTFGMSYTQDESYYILEAGQDAAVYLGVQENTDKAELMQGLKDATNNNNTFNDERFINKFPVKKHDHILIPAGTVHCGGKNTVILEISATPYIFTFKLWDWDRIGLDGLPRPVHLDHGEVNLDINKSTKWVENNLINQIKQTVNDDSLISENTGLDEDHFIQTTRHWITKPVTLETNQSVNMLNLVEGESAIIESDDHSFSPFEVHFGETFIIPEAVKTFIVRPYKNNLQTQLCLLQAYVRY